MTEPSPFRKNLFFWAVAVPASLWVVWNVLSFTNPGYRSERALWGAEMAARKIGQDPDSTPPMVVEQSVERLKKIIERYPKTEAAARAQQMIGEVYGARKEYPEAREEFQKVIDRYPTHLTWVLSAYHAIAFTYQKEKNPGKAIEVYRTLIKKYPLNPAVQNVPLEIVGLSRRDIPQNADPAMREAIAHYKEVLAQTSPREPVAFTAREFLVGCYLETKQWNEAVQELETLILTYPQRPEVAVWFKMVDQVSRGQLNQPGRVQDVAGQFAEKYPARRQVAAPWLKGPEIPASR